MCLAGDGLLHKRWLLAGRFEPFYCNDKYFCHWIQRIQWKHLGKTPNMYELRYLDNWNKGAPSGRRLVVH